MPADARLVVDRPEDLPGESPGESERSVEVAEVLRGQPPEHRGPLALAWQAPMLTPASPACACG
jgi:hypothetical protein